MTSLDEYRKWDCVDIVKQVSSETVRVDEIRQLAIEALDGIEGWNVMDEVYRDDPLNSQSGLLLGVPLVHKDAGAQLKGKARSFGSRFLENHRAETTSRVFELLQNEGVQIVGRTRVPEMHLSVTGDNAVLGSTPNPFNPRYSMGGSTAGIAAVALGAVPVAHGGDSGGSLRIPASWAGCYTIKPTRGRVSNYPAGNPLYGLNHIFVGTRSLRDLRLFLRVLGSGGLGDFSDSRQNAAGDDLGARLVGLCTSMFGGRQANADQTIAATRTARRMEALGFDVEELSMNLDFDAYVEALYVIFSIDLRQTINEVLQETDRRPEDYCQEYVAEWYYESLSINAEELGDAVDYVYRTARSVARLGSRYACLVSPATAEGPPELDSLHAGRQGGSRGLNRRFEEIVHFSGPTNISGQPSLVLPSYVGDNGIPVGVQLVAKHGLDESLLGLAELIDEGFRPPRASRTEISVDVQSVH